MMRILGLLLLTGLFIDSYGWEPFFTLAAVAFAVTLAVRMIVSGGGSR